LLTLNLRGKRRARRTALVSSLMVDQAQQQLAMLRLDVRELDGGTPAWNRVADSCLRFHRGKVLGGAKMEGNDRSRLELLLASDKEPTPAQGGGVLPKSLVAQSEFHREIDTDARGSTIVLAAQVS